MVPISLRMKAIADMVPAGYSVADIGCDHGFVAIYLVTQKNSPLAIAMDINEGPLIRAAEHIKQYDLDNVISTRLSDGAVKLDDHEVDCAIIAGMGGKLTIKILDESIDKFKHMKCFVLSPHSDIPAVREYLSSYGFVIEDEDMVFDEGKYYMIMRCKNAQAVTDEAAGAECTLDEAQIAFGPKLIEKKHPVLKEYLGLEYEKTKDILDMLQDTIKNAKDNKREALDKRIDDVNRRLSLIKKTIENM